MTSKITGQLKATPKSLVRSMFVAALFLGVVSSSALGADTSGGAVETDGRTVYQLLLGEIALHRGELEIAVLAYAEVARRSKDPEVLRRAVHVAVGAKRTDLALEFARLFVEVEPDSVRARHALLSVLAGLGRTEEALPHIRFLLAQDAVGRPRLVMHLIRVFVNHSDKSAAVTMLEELLAPYPELPEAHYALASVAEAGGVMFTKRTLRSIGKALELRPDWTQAALFEARVLVGDSNAAAISSLSRFIERNPDDDEALIQRARLYGQEKQYDSARVDLENVLSRRPDFISALFPLAIVALHQEDKVEAEKILLKLSERDFGGLPFVLFELGTLAEMRDDHAAAIDYFGRVERGEYFVRAQARKAQIISKQGNNAEALAYLRDIEKDNPDLSSADKARLVLAEAYLLREGKQFEAAYDLLGEALKEHPDEPDLLYDQALLADRLNRVEVLENNLSRVIVLRPESAHAYNALGYSLAERNVRLEEARQLIGKALTLAPADPFILDSMGWVLYRLGLPEDALLHLERAYQMRSDPEIAAHLGEVLWSLNRRDEARTLWKDAQQRHPADEALSAVVRRFVH